MVDMIVVGGGPSGMCAALYGARSGLDVIMFEKLFTGGQAATTYEIENYLGFDEGISGPDLTMKMENHVRRFGAKIKYDEVVRLELEGPVKKVHTAKEVYEAKTVILSMGAVSRELGLPGERDLRGMGVSYCATCDGMFFKGKPVAVAGGGNTAAEDALFLSRTSSKVYLIHRRDELRAIRVLADAVKNTPNIEVLWDSVVEELLSGIDILEKVAVRNLKTGEKTEVPVNGIFVAIGTVPSTELVKDQVGMNEAGYILTDENLQTSVKGVFAAGDLRQKPLRQVITAAADGAVASYNAARYIMEGGI